MTVIIYLFCLRNVINSTSINATDEVRKVTLEVITLETFVVNSPWHQNTETQTSEPPVLSKIRKVTPEITTLKTFGVSLPGHITQKNTETQTREPPALSTGCLMHQLQLNIFSW